MLVVFPPVFVEDTKMIYGQCRSSFIKLLKGANSGKNQ